MKPDHSLHTGILFLLAHEAIQARADAAGVPVEVALEQAGQEYCVQRDALLGAWGHGTAAYLRAVAPQIQRRAQG